MHVPASRLGNTHADFTGEGTEILQRRTRYLSCLRQRPGPCSCRLLPLYSASDGCAQPLCGVWGGPGGRGTAWSRGSPPGCHGLHPGPPLLPSLPSWRLLAAKRRALEDVRPPHCSCVACCQYGRWRESLNDGERRQRVQRPLRRSCPLQSWANSRSLWTSADAPSADGNAQPRLRGHPPVSLGNAGTQHNSLQTWGPLSAPPNLCPTQVPRVVTSPIRALCPQGCPMLGCHKGRLPGQGGQRCNEPPCHGSSWGSDCPVTDPRDCTRGSAACPLPSSASSPVSPLRGLLATWR